MKLGTAEADFDGTVYLKYDGCEPFECIDEIALSDSYRGIEFDIIDFNGRVVIDYPFGNVRLRNFTTVDSKLVKCIPT